MMSPTGKRISVGLFSEAASHDNELSTGGYGSSTNGEDSKTDDGMRNVVPPALQTNEAEGDGQPSSFIGSALKMGLPRSKAAVRHAKASARRIIKNSNPSMKSLSLRRRSSTGNLQLRGHARDTSGFMYKRRTGMTGLAASIFHQGGESWTERKFGGRLWVLRYFTIKKGVMHYYDVPKHIVEAEERALLNGSTDTQEFIPAMGSERGTIDLSRYGVQLRLSYGHNSYVTTMLHELDKGKAKVDKDKKDKKVSASGDDGGVDASQDDSGEGNGFVIGEVSSSQGAILCNTLTTDNTRSPSPYQLEIVYNNVLRPNEWQTWTLCCTDKNDMIKWISAISSVVYAQRGTHGKFLQKEETPENNLNETEFEDFEDPASYDVGSPASVQYGGASETDSTTSDISGNFDHKASLDNASETNSVNSYSGPIQQPEMGKAEWLWASLPVVHEGRLLEVGVALCLTCLMLLFRQDVGMIVSVGVLTMVNLVTLWAFMLVLRKLGLGPSNNLNASMNATGHSHTAAWLSTVPTPAESSKFSSSQHNGTNQGVATARHNMSNSRLAGKLLSSRAQFGAIVPFKTYEEIMSASEKLEHFWTIADDSLLMMRMGPDYKKYGNKSSTKPSLYKTIGVEFFESKQKIMDLLGNLVNPPFSKCVDRAKLPDNFPQLLVINFQLPRPECGVFSSADGPGYNFAMYHTPSDALVKILADKAQGKVVEPAVLLLERWFNDAHKEGQTALKERLKLVGFVLNLDKCGMPSWSKRYNGKPVIVRRSGVITKRCTKDISTFEVDIDLRMWGMMTRKGISALLPGAVAKMEFIVSFVIEGQENDELPERSLVSTQISYLHTDRAQPVF